MAGEQILLLPRVDYFKWVRAVQKYALHYGVGITPDPIKVGGYQTVTAVITPDGYPHEGNIEVWLRRRYPNIKLDAVHAGSAERLAEILSQRVEKEQRYGPSTAKSAHLSTANPFPKDRLYLFWPTDYPTISQSFGAHPEIYSQYGLPGHEGIDVRAPQDARVYACALGEVYMIEDEDSAHNYGKHVRIQHSNGYRTVYANLSEVVVEVGDSVEARQLIGYAGGNPDRPHLHLTLKKDEATQSGETNYPGDVIDPTPYMVYPHLDEEVREVLGMPEPDRKIANYPWTRPCLVGVAAREGGDMQGADFEAIVQARVEAVRVNRAASIPTINRLREISSDIFLLAQIVHLPDEGMDWSAKAWMDAVRQDMDRLYQANVRYFELQRLPNIQQFGWNQFWHSGESFGEWWLEVFQTLRGDYPDARFGFPGVMAGGQVPGRRLDAQVFLDGADPAMLEADWLGVVCYWNSQAGQESKDEGRFYEVIRQRYPEKLLYITEFGNTNQHVRAAAKGEGYKSYYQSLRDVPGIGAAFAQVVSAASGYDTLVWRDEAGKLNEIGLQVGKRED